MPVYDKLCDYEKAIHHVLVRHEQGAIHAAQGYARVTGEPGVVIVTSGPGATNVITGVADAMTDSTPVVVITGQVSTAALGNHVKVKVVKNKMAPPFKKAEFDIVFGEGISRSGEIVDLGVELGIIQKSGSWFSYNETKLAQGREAVKKLMMDNPELAEEIEAKIREALANVQD